MQTALSAMDKLLRSNELVFQILALLPAVTIAGALITFLSSVLRRRSVRAFRLVGRDLKTATLQVARAIHACSKVPRDGTGRDEAEGQLLFSCHALAEAIRGSAALSLDTRAWVMTDLDDLLVSGDAMALGPEGAATRRERVLSIIRETLKADRNAKSIIM